MRQKTSMPQEVTFNQKITKAIHHKKNLINNMALTRQRPQHAHSYRLSPFASAKTQHGLKTQQDLTPTPQARTVQVSEQMTLDYLEDHDIGAGVCGSHPNKRAAFEDK